MSGHTPGPWRYAPEMRSIMAANGETVAYGLVIPRAENANVLIAAPESHDANKKALVALEAIESHENQNENLGRYQDWGIVREAFTALRAAIAKSEGGG